MPTSLFLYARKSSESEDRQILSIDSQVKELQDAAIKQGFIVARVFKEAQSAKAPGRPVFGEMLKLLSKGEAQGILCWKLDRLARNPVDGGALIWAMDQGRIKEIVTPNRSFHKSGDDAFWMQLEFGIAKKYVDDLSDNIRRGLRAKANLGEPPFPQLPHGYTRDPKTGLVIADPERFDLVKRMWEEVLRGVYRPIEVLKFANTVWGFRTPVHGCYGGKPLARSSFYHILETPFYMGIYEHERQVYQGHYPAMVTPEEYKQVQRLLRRKDRPRPQTQLEFAYRGLITCEKCHRKFTVEQKTNRFGSRYVYYHCSRTRPMTVFCDEPYLEEQVFETQVQQWLRKLVLPQPMYEWVMEHADQGEDSAQIQREQERQTRERALRGVEQQLKNLRQMRLLDHLTEEEYWVDKQRLSIERGALLKALNGDNGLARTIEPLSSFFSFAQLAEKTLRRRRSHAKTRDFAKSGVESFRGRSRFANGSQKAVPVVTGTA